MNVDRAQADVTFYGYDPATNYHAIGTQQGGSEWGAASDAGAGYLTYGPYSSKFQNGAFEAKYTLSVDNNLADDLVVAYVDVYDDVTNVDLARREIHRKEFTHADSFQDFPLSFVTTGANRLEFRIFVLGKAFLTHASTTVKRTSTLARANLIANHQLSLEEKLGGASGRTSSEQEDGYITRAVSVDPQTAGNYIARLNLRIEDSSRDDSKVATADVYNRATNFMLTKMEVKLKEFLLPRTGQSFELPFEYDGVGELDIRVRFPATTHVKLLSATLSPAFALSYQGADAPLRHQLGSATNRSWSANKSDGRGYLTFGPYTRDVPPGVATATFRLLIDDIEKKNEVVAVLDAYDSMSGSVLAKRSIWRNDFIAASSPRDFDLVFEVPQAASLEFRIFTYGLARLEHQATTVIPDRLTLAALWNSQVHWEYRKRDVFTSKEVQDYATSSLISLDGIWYAFNRVPAIKLDAGQLKSCTQKGFVPLQIVVRRSADRARTWSEPVVVATPSSSPASPDYCEIVDGGAYFDPETDIWHYLAQCINQSAGWNLCHYTRAGSSPMGTFRAEPTNPVIVGGQLWGKICEGNAKACPSTMKDEGTPQILGKSSDGYFYVTFHGANYGSIVTGARGVARTSDFIHWQVTGEHLPGDAMLNASDCAHWNAGWGAGGCIGEGDARILRSDGRYYILTEAADESLICQIGQKWVFGLLRNTTLGVSGSWQNYGENPIIVNDNISPVGCALQYMNLVRDRGELYLDFSLYSPDYPFPSYVYQLVDGAAAAKMRVH